MKNNIILLIFVILLFDFPLESVAQQYWAIVKIDTELGKPTFTEYHSEKESSFNGVEYQRIYDDGGRFPYGYRLAKKRIYIFDFDNQKESLAYDFSLSEGDTFTTYNGMEWKIEETKDTLVKIIHMNEDEYISKKLFHVRTLDGQLSDQWLEDFGSFSNHLMIDTIENTRCSQLLWFEYTEGQYMTREIQEDPFFTHDSGWLKGTNSDENEEEVTNCYYEDGNLVLENVQFSWPHREYNCYHREGSDIYRVYSWELEPHLDVGEYSLIKDVTMFKGLPMPSSGSYVLHIGNDEYTTRIRSIYNSTKRIYYDIYGRRLISQPTNRIFISLDRRHKGILHSYF